MQQNNSSDLPARTENTDLRILSKQPEHDVSVLPLESLKLPPRGRRRTTQTAEQKFLHLSKSKSPTPSRINSAKQLVFRAGGVRYVSEEKGRQLEETCIMARERRLNRAELEKKVLGLVSPRLREQLNPQQQLKKFKRSEEKRLLAETKKFKRIKEKPDEQQIAIREKIMKKLMEDPRNFLSGIAEKSEDLYVSQLDLGGSKGVSVFQQTVSESMQEDMPSSVLQE